MITYFLKEMKCDEMQKVKASSVRSLAARRKMLWSGRFSMAACGDGRLQVSPFDSFGKAGTGIYVAKRVLRHLTGGSGRRMIAH